MWYVYIVKCSKDNSLYTGITNNLSKRIEQHNKNRGAKYTKGRGPIILLKSFECPNKSSALKLEFKIKKLSRKEKLKLIAGYMPGGQTKKEINMKEDFTAIAVIMDASGSMATLTKDTIGSFNQFLAEQQALPGEAAFSLCTFNTDYRLVHDFVPLANVSQLTEKTYRPGGGTALLDAMGTTIDALGAKLAAMPEEDRASKVIVLVITDGEENSSKRFTLEQIKAKVTHQQDKYNWLFVFIGANIDAISAGISLGVTSANSVNYTPTSGGTRSLYSNISSNMGSYRTARGVGAKVDFFNQTPTPVPPTGAVSSTPDPTVVTQVFDPGHSLPKQK